MSLSRRVVAVAGAALVLACNAIALVGAGYNRGGDPESVLRLSQRELDLPYNWGFQRENSGLELRLAWRVLPREAGPGQPYSYGYGEPAWLDEAKMRELGFDAFDAVEVDERDRYGRQLPREVFLVLELDGAAYRESLERVRRWAATELTQGDERQRVAREALAREENKASRLYVVDAGRDSQALRARHADRGRYAIVSGKIRSAHFRNRPAAGYVAGVLVDSIHVPLEWRGAFESAQAARQRSGAAESRYEVTLAYGRRLEPWIVSAKQQP